MLSPHTLDRPYGVPGCWVLFLIAGVFTASAATAAETALNGPTGENVALGAKYTLWPQPNYSYCTEPGDATQLTDGQSTTEYFWVQKGTVGWQHAPYATITVDLGQVQPIAGVSLTTAAGVAGVTWPLAVQLLVSDDGKTYRNAGDLVALDRKLHGPFPEAYAIRRVFTDKLRTRGRFLQFVVIPLPGGPYIFSDEVEVFRGPEELLEIEPAGEVIDDVKQFHQRGRISRGVQLRFETDAQAIRRAVDEAELADESIREKLLHELEGVCREFDPAGVADDPSFQALLPMGEVHSRLFRVQAKLWKSLGYPTLSARASSTWAPLDLHAPPPDKAPGSLEVHTMRGEYRAAAFELFNSHDRPLAVRISFEGLFQSPKPEYLTVHEVQWTDTSRGKPVAAALPEAAGVEDGWTVTIEPGIVRQVWLTFHAMNVPPGDHVGRIVVESDDVQRLHVPIRLRVWPMEFPERTTLWLGGWSYTNGGGAYGVTPQNRRQFVEHLKEHFVNAPWATSGVMMNYEFPGNDPGKIRLDTRQFDAWIKEWPRAGRYMVFLSVSTACGGARIGTPEFEHRVGTWISAWVSYLEGKGISPGQLGLLIRDEPHDDEQAQRIIAWARAIKKAEPAVLIWEDPTYRDPGQAPPEMFEVCDVLCPNRPMWMYQGKRFEQFYLDQQRKGRELQFYSCSGPARLLDPYSYYRLQAWHCWQAQATGTFFWAFGDNSNTSSWNEYFATAGPFTPLFLDDETVTAGKRMEAIRESVQDYEYFVMLRKAVDRAKAAGRSTAVIQQAESLLASAAEEVLADQDVEALQWHEPKDRTKADAVRIEILRVLDAIQ